MPRTNIYDAGSVINNPIHIVESLLRDEIFVERNLIAETNVNYPTDNIHIYCTKLRGKVNTYYDGAYVINYTRNAQAKILSYDATNTYITLSASISGQASGDNFIITNVQGNNLINEASFDALSSTFSTYWCRKSITEKVKVSDLLKEILFESHCYLGQSFNELKIYNLVTDTGTTNLITASNILIKDGKPDVSCRLIDIEKVKNKFTLNYSYDYATDKYKNNLCKDSLNNIKCSNATSNYLLHNNEFTYDAQWLYTDVGFINWLVDWFTFQKFEIELRGDFSLFKYEIGDQCKINDSRWMPANLNNSAIFIVKGKEIDFSTFSVKLTLLQML